MKQEEIVNEIRQMCGQTILMPSLGSLLYSFCGRTTHTEQGTIERGSE